MGQGNDDIEESPARLREAIAQVRDDLGAHLGELWALRLPTSKNDHDDGDQAMTSESKPKRSASRGEQPAAKSKPTPKSKAKSTSKGKKSSPAGIVEGVASKAGHVLDTMAAGAVVGAVKAAAQSLPE